MERNGVIKAIGTLRFGLMQTQLTTKNVVLGSPSTVTSMYIGSTNTVMGGLSEFLLQTKGITWRTVPTVAPFQVDCPLEELQGYSKYRTHHKRNPHHGEKSSTETSIIESIVGYVISNVKANDN